MLVFSFCLLAAPSAFAAASYVFEPTLSLTGNCVTTPLDEVPDPGPCPGTPEVDHPSAGFKSPSVTTDAYGDIYVVNVVDKESRIDIFSPAGLFISEFKDPAGAQSIAVDANGNMYLFERLQGGERQVRRFTPTVYKPEEEEVAYGGEPFVLTNESTKELLVPLGPESSLDVDRATGRVYFNDGFTVSIFGSAAEENKLLEKGAIDAGERTTAIAVDSVHKKVYLSVRVPVTHKTVIRVFELEAPHKELGKIDGSTTPKGEFLSGEGFLSIDVDDNTGHVFVGDLAAAKKVYEFEEDGTYLATIEHGFEVVPFEEIAVDDGPFSPRPQVEGWLFVPSHPSPSLGHVFAFEPKEVGPPIVEEVSVSDVTETEATLHATINPDGLPTEYRLEYITQQQWEEDGKSFANATVAKQGTLPKGGEGVAVSVSIAELEPGVSYRFRVFAENEEGSDEKERAFVAAPAEEEPPVCANAAFRTAFSALLPDCRAYELVTPPDTNGHPPTSGFAGVYFATLRAAPDGNRASFLIEGGTLPGKEGAGAFNGDPYLATRTAEGWTTQSAGPTGEEATGPNPGSVSPDQTYSFWEDIQGPAVYIRYPDGHSELVGRGSLGEDTKVEAELMTENATHIVFQTTDLNGHVAQQLEPNAPPTGTTAVYDRSAEGPTQVVSLLPGNEPQKAGEDALFLGASEDGEGIAFEISGTIYLRLHNTETFKVADPGSTFAGVADEGNRVFYLEGGDLFAFDAAAEETIEFSSSGNVIPVNVAEDGTRAYFVSPSVLTGESNPNGEEAEAGEENLYLSEEGAISFVGIVTERDVEGEERSDGLIGGLGLWIESLEERKPAIDPSRTTPTGTTLLFESRADLTGFESEGFAQVYRYDATEDRLDCLSCSPTGTPPASDASLQSISKEQFSPEAGGSHLKIPNQSLDGQRAFFQTAEPLVLGDTDGKLDVYEWEASGVGSCSKGSGCIYLISGGQSPSPDYLFAMSSSGSDVFFRTADQLLPRDLESTLSIYDARVDGGFAEPSENAPCVAIDTCQPTPPPVPALPVPGAQTPSEGNVPPQRKGCPKGKHKAKRHGKTVCVKNHKKSHHRTSHKKRGGSR